MMNSLLYQSNYDYNTVYVIMQQMRVQQFRNKLSIGRSWWPQAGTDTDGPRWSHLPDCEAYPSSIPQGI